MRRRKLLALLAGVAAVRPLAAAAQQKAMPVIGILGGFSPSASAQIELELAAFRKGLGETGYVEGRNVTIEYTRAAEGHLDRLPALAADLVSRKVDVIVTQGGDPSVVCCKRCHLDDPDRIPFLERPGCGRSGPEPRPAGRKSHWRRHVVGRADAQTAGAAVGIGSASAGDGAAGRSG